MKIDDNILYSVKQYKNAQPFVCCICCEKRLNIKTNPRIKKKIYKTKNRLGSHARNAKINAIRAHKHSTQIGLYYVSVSICSFPYIYKYVVLDPCACVLLHSVFELKADTSSSEYIVFNLILKWWMALASMSTKLLKSSFGLGRLAKHACWNRTGTASDSVVNRTSIFVFAIHCRMLFLLTRMIEWDESSSFTSFVASSCHTRQTHNLSILPPRTPRSVIPSTANRHRWAFFLWRAYQVVYCYRRSWNFDSPKFVCLLRELCDTLRCELWQFAVINEVSACDSLSININASSFMPVACRATTSCTL